MSSISYWAGYTHMSTKLAGLAGALPVLGGAVLGGLGGAYLSPDDRARGAAIGAISGGAAGSMGQRMRGAAPAGYENEHAVRSVLTGALGGSATAGVASVLRAPLQRDAADTEQYVASPEYQAMLEAHAAPQKAPKQRFDFDTWSDATQRQLDVEATAAGSPL